MKDTLYCTEAVSIELKKELESSRENVKMKDKIDIILSGNILY